MDRKWNEATIMESWRRCAQVGPPPDPTEKCYPLSGPELQQLFEIHRAEIEAFRSVVSDCPFPKNTVFLLVDWKGTLLEIWPARGVPEGVQKGFSFSEEYAGANAVSLALRLNEPVWTLREQNYLSCLSRVSLYCVPHMGVPFGHCVALLTKAKLPAEWPIALLEQLALRMAKALQGRAQALNPPVAVSKRQREVLQCIAHGMKDREIAAELHISLDTVRYHKKNIYQLLNTDNRVSAVVQALKRNMIGIEQIGKSQ